MKLPVEVSVIADLMSVIGNATDELRPLFRMCAEYEERRLDIERRERVEYSRRRPRIRAVIERQSNSFLTAGKPPENGSE
jgi:hypothetical protein